MHESKQKCGSFTVIAGNLEGLLYYNITQEKPLQISMILEAYRIPFVSTFGQGGVESLGSRTSM